MAAATTRPHTPVGPSLRSDALTAPQFCDEITPVSRTLTPILAVSSGAPAWNTGRPNLAAGYEVAPAGLPVIARATVRFDTGFGRYQIPAGVLTDGEYRFRVRAVDGAKASDWLPWCAFTVATRDVTVPETPTDLRVSASFYETFQSCAAGAPVIDAIGSPTFAASPGPSATANVTARFEIARPGLATIVVSGNPYGVNVPPASFTAGGAYRFRARAEDGTAVSAWSPWCAFTAR
ncbi:hypothetical protein ACTI_74690 [Actinoplanes sp. OR16]|uniref:hypothetical protein n=1 Tax=Actinoplanes sp. OR16 TaxID=946334 RepID=UPI000F6D7EE7|nr:hypothetical protein [Actinoplanes sp. OR16]BBH70784.1 hypothetical protein ACTI_74690 [Actinoplanes sp. OR16]